MLSVTSQDQEVMSSFGTLLLMMMLKTMNKKRRSLMLLLQAITTTVLSKAKTKFIRGEWVKIMFSETERIQTNSNHINLMQECLKRKK